MNDQGVDLRGPADAMVAKIQDVLASTGPEVTLFDLLQFETAGGWALASQPRTIIFAVCPDQPWPGVKVFLDGALARYRGVSVRPPAEDAAEQTFADHPTTLGEKRAGRSHAADDWTPRDLLVKLLREHDSGEVVLTDMIVSFRADGVAGFWNACADRTMAAGLAAQAMVALSSDVAP